MQIKLPDYVKEILKTLHVGGYEAYIVGGCVRDAILGREPEDWDITTSAKPEKVKELFSHTVDTGIAHGTVTVLVQGGNCEVTTYRIDGEYEDNRHPKEIAFTQNLREDLLRRDFTINAMAYNEEVGIVDVFEGIEDLNRKVIRAVGNAKERFSEDALRILRALRFAAQLGFEIEEITGREIKNHAENLTSISAERIRTELVKLLISQNPEKIRSVYEMGITKVILPEFDAMMETAQETPHHMYNVGEHTIKALGNIEPQKVLRLTMLLHDIGKPSMKTIDENGRAHFKKHELKSEEMARGILHRLKFDNETLRAVCHLIKYHDYRMPATQQSVRRAMNKIGKDFFIEYIQVRKADTLAQSEYKREGKLQNLAEVTKRYEEIIQKGQCVSIKELEISGKELLELGMKQGKEIGECLEEILQQVLQDPELNKREKLLEIVKKYCILKRK